MSTHLQTLYITTAMLKEQLDKILPKEYKEYQ
jgi:hypothetical protein